MTPAFGRGSPFASKICVTSPMANTLGVGSRQRSRIDGHPFAVAGQSARLDHGRSPVRRDGDEKVERELVIGEDDAPGFDSLDLACDPVRDPALRELLAHPGRAFAAGVRHQHRLHRRDGDLAAVAEAPRAEMLVRCGSRTRRARAGTGTALPR